MLCVFSEAHILEADLVSTFCMPPPEAEVNEEFDIHSVCNDSSFLHFGALCSCDLIIIHLKLRKKLSIQANLCSATSNCKSELQSSSKEYTF